MSSSEEQPCPGIDFGRVRTENTMEQVLSRLGFQPWDRSGPQRYGSCPLRESRSGRRRSFLVNVAIGRYYGYRCRSQGNQLELWAAARKLPLYQAAMDPCHRWAATIPGRGAGADPIGQGADGRHRMSSPHQTEKRRGHRYLKCPSNRKHPIDYLDRMYVNYRDHSHRH